MFCGASLTLAPALTGALCCKLWCVHCTLQSMGQYWPEENEECECGPFIIEAMTVDHQVPDVILRELKLTYQPTVCLCTNIYHGDAIA